MNDKEILFEKERIVQEKPKVEKPKVEKKIDKKEIADAK